MERQGKFRCVTHPSIHAPPPAVRAQGRRPEPTLATAGRDRAQPAKRCCAARTNLALRSAARAITASAHEAAIASPAAPARSSYVAIGFSSTNLSKRACVLAPGALQTPEV